MACRQACERRRVAKRKPASGSVLTRVALCLIISRVIVLRGEPMKIGRQLSAALLLPLLPYFAPPARSAQGKANQSRAQAGPFVSPLAPAAPDDTATKAEAYYDFVMGHYHAQEYQVSSRADDANQAIDFLKKAFVLDPSSQQIGDELAEIYYQSQRIRDAVNEAQSILNKDPDNIGAHRLLARIYVRTLGDLSNTQGQRDTLVRATEQYREILRLDPTDTDAPLWLARLYRLQNEPDKAESVLRALLAREPANEGAVEQLTQLLLDEGKSKEGIALLQGMLQHAPTPRLWELLGDAYNQIHDLPNAEMAYRKAAESQPDDIHHLKVLAQTLLIEEKFPEALEQYQDRKST